MWDVGSGVFGRLFEGVVVMDGYRRGGCMWETRMERGGGRNEQAGIKLDLLSGWVLSCL
jgi:hypothetical protein